MVIVDAEYFVAVVRHVAFDAVTEIAYVVGPVQTDFDTGIFDVTAVDIGSRCSPNTQSCGLNEPAERQFFIPVERESQSALEEAGIQSDVGLAGSFPSQVGIGDSVGICADGILRFVFAEVIDSGIGCAADGDCFEIGEMAYVAVTVFTPAGTDFQLVHEIDILFEEVLFVNIPTGRYRGEVAPAVSTGKVGRTVGAHGHAGHVLAGIVIIDTAEERDETTVVPR